MNEAKVKVRKERQRILQAVDLIEAKKCGPCHVVEKQNIALCKGCEHFEQLNALGEELLSLTNDSRTIPKELNKSAFQLLLDRDWTKKEIQKYYNISNNDFSFFLAQNNLQKSYSKQTKIDLKTYQDWIGQGKKDYAFCEYYGISVGTLQVFKGGFEIKKNSKTEGINNNQKGVGERMAKITVEQYKKCLGKNMKDKEIAKLYDMSISSLYQFKSTNGLSAKKPRKVDVIKEDKAFIEAYENKEIEVIEEEIAAAEKGMPVIESDWKTPSLAEKITEPVVVFPDTSAIEMQYKFEKLERDLQLWKSRHMDTERKFFDLSSEYRKLDVDFRNAESHCRMIEKENAELKETVQLNHLLMKQQVRFLDRLDAMVESSPAEVGEFVWR